MWCTAKKVRASLGEAAPDASWMNMERFIAACPKPGMNRPKKLVDNSAQHVQAFMEARIEDSVPVIPRGKDIHAPRGEMHVAKPGQGKSKPWCVIDAPRWDDLPLDAVLQPLSRRRDVRSGFTKRGIYTRKTIPILDAKCTLRGEPVNVTARLATEPVQAARSAVRMFSLGADPGIALLAKKRTNASAAARALAAAMGKQTAPSVQTVAKKSHTAALAVATSVAQHSSRKPPKHTSAHRNNARAQSTCVLSKQPAQTPTNKLHTTKRVSATASTAVSLPDRSASSTSHVKAATKKQSALATALATGQKENIRCNKVKTAVRRANGRLQAGTVTRKHNTVILAPKLAAVSKPNASAVSAAVAVVGKPQTKPVPTHSRQTKISGTARPCPVTTAQSAAKISQAFTKSHVRTHAHMNLPKYSRKDTGIQQNPCISLRKRNSAAAAAALAGVTRAPRQPSLPLVESCKPRVHGSREAGHAGTNGSFQTVPKTRATSKQPHVSATTNMSKHNTQMLQSKVKTSAQSALSMSALALSTSHQHASSAGPQEGVAYTAQKDSVSAFTSCVSEAPGAPIAPVLKSSMPQPEIDVNTKVSAADPRVQSLVPSYTSEARGKAENVNAHRRWTQMVQSQRPKTRSDVLLQACKRRGVFSVTSAPTSKLNRSCNMTACVELPAKKRDTVSQSAGGLAKGRLPSGSHEIVEGAKLKYTNKAGLHRK